MTYIIVEPCIDIKDRWWVDVCPVDCTSLGRDGRRLASVEAGGVAALGYAN